MRHQKGFTLIEVLVALLVFGLIATAAAEVGSQYISSYERIRDKTLAGWLADNRINELRLEENLPGISENSRDTDYGPFRWQVTTRVLATEEPTMRRVEVTVARYRNERSDPAPVHTLSAFLGQN
ncbi:type II secretion system minor pseudopilin GspI [Marinobacter sp. M216]|uniref:Type II secretion system protein I n=1 Tax=Marinobacter albus TaxID=3030833 RepID=A0ABT7HD71_9GAMM|nr:MULTISPECIES: type II secretion system minor pseudopilin GspI [unclassified Marinobacter]MBW7469767.1 type II secretion system minor pseudopilin GspI [Marinobacter sp. F4218]MDK9557974.1 type II secretion system minor pseudopilin GspI [Marinobacter sp. M216]